MPPAPSYHFDANLRDVPDDPGAFEAAIIELQAQLEGNKLSLKQRARLLGTIGSYQRILGRLEAAQASLHQAIELCREARDRRLETVNLLRLAHVYQWQGNFQTSDGIFLDCIAGCETDPELEGYVDFARQHYGKSLFDQGRYTEAEREFLSALESRRAKADGELVESSELALLRTRERMGGETNRPGG